MVFESDVPRGDPSFVAGVRAQYAGQIAQLRRRFEALRGEEKLLRREPEGDDLDFDAVVEAYADRRTGMEVTERLFTLRRRAERNIAVMFMVDMSGSTMGWINECERTALVMLCEALEALGDRYAIYGFSGWGRKRCEIYRIKRFGERYAEDVRARIAGVQAKDYTRMGVAIRHLSKLLNEVDAKTRILFTLSDGKPDDFIDGYRGVYGIEDTRQALIEARQSGVHPFCITIDEAARDYLPHMYGQGELGADRRRAEAPDEGGGCLPPADELSAQTVSPANAVVQSGVGQGSGVLPERRTRSCRKREPSHLSPRSSSSPQGSS